MNKHDQDSSAGEPNANPNSDGAPQFDDLFTEVKKFEAEAARFKSLADENFEKLLRAQADFENFRTRMQRTMETNEKYALEKFLRELLPVIDNFERSLEHASDAANLQEGLKMTLSLLQSTLEKFKVQAINPENTAFNPALHEAMATETKPDVAAGTVLKVLQKGYQLHERLLRPALVIISN